MARTCIFCTNDSGSAEHIWADWLNEVLEELIGEGDTLTGWMRQYDLEDESDARWYTKAKIANITTNTLCHECNTGWMSNLEGQAKPILAPMVKGWNKSLSATELIVAATWAVKTVIVMQSTFPDGVRFSPFERQILKDQLRPPLTTRVIIASVVEPYTRLGYGEIGFLDPEDETVVRYQFSTLQVGHLVFQVARDSVVPAEMVSMDGVKLPIELEAPPGVAISIFPPFPRIEWPPLRPLKGEALVGFMRRGVTVPDSWRVPLRYEGPDKRLRPPVMKE